MHVARATTEPPPQGRAPPPAGPAMTTPRPSRCCRSPPKLPHALPAQRPCPSAELSTGTVVPNVYPALEATLLASVSRVRGVTVSLAQAQAGRMGVVCGTRACRGGICRGAGLRYSPADDSTATLYSYE